MVDTPNKKFPLMASNQSQKHVTYNELLIDLDVIVQSSVISASITAPPGSPAEGDTYIVPSGATGAWSGHTNKITMWYGGAWVMQNPQVGWRCWNQATSELLVFSGGVWTSFLNAVFSAGIADDVFTLNDNVDSTKKARFELSGITTSTTRTYTLPNIDSTIAVLSGIAQTFANSTTFSGGTTTLGTTTTVSGTMTITAASATLGNSTATSTYNLGTGATLTATTKTINIGTAGVSGSTTVINLGSAVSGALGSMVINSPTVTFANSVTVVGMPQANLTALYLGLGGATADASNRLSINTPQVLLNNAGSGIEMTFNKNAAGNDASLAFKTGFSTRALAGLLGDDDWRLKVSPNGSTWFDALVVDRSTGQVSAPNSLVVTGAITGTAVTQSAIDTTAGRLVKTGDFGLGTAITLTASDNLNALVTSGLFYNPSGGNCAGNNYPMTSAGALTVVTRSATNVVQKFVSYGGSSTAADVREFTRSYGTAGFSPWVELFHQGTVLGAVSQSGGVPTGKVIERGSNANGEYVRFADGTQICNVTAAAVDTTTAAGAVYMHTNILTWTFPAAFAAAPVVAGGGGNAARWLAPNAPSVNSAAYRVYSYGSSGATSAPSLTAIGRWF